MGFFNNLFDNFKAEDFHMNSRMKISSVQRLFKDNFGLTLRVYKGKQFADPKMTISQLDKGTADKIHANKKDITINNMFIIETEDPAIIEIGITENSIKNSNRVYFLKISLN